MSRRLSSILGKLMLALILMLSLVWPAWAEWNEQVLYSFQGGTSDGYWPAGGVVFDQLGNLYGATQGAGGGNCAPISGECGLVFQLSPPAQKGAPWTETILYQFEGKESNDASVPTSALLFDKEGNLYGVTAYGGTGNCVLLGTPAGCGTVYEISPPKQKGDSWTETILYSFKSGNDGYYPQGSLSFDQAGNLYGATIYGGGKGNTCDPYYGGNCGTVFKLSPPKRKGGAWTEQVLHSFAGGTDGALPNAGLVIRKNGTIYGTTPTGGNQDCNYGHGDIGCGIAFELLPSKQGRAWKEGVLHRFSGGNDGAGPDCLIPGAGGSLFGAAGGGPNKDGLVFRLTPTKSGRWDENVLYDFPGGNDGQGPGGLIFDLVGNLYGTAAGGVGFYGIVFRLDRPKHGNSWTETVLYSFTQRDNGAGPEYALILDKKGDLYGTTDSGGTGNSCTNGCGVVYQVSP